MADRISTLPDEVLCHILSFLPTEEVVSTMLVSKRWKNLWLYVPAIDISHLTIGKTYSVNSVRFIRFIYAFLLARAVPIKRFRLNYGTSDDVKSFPFSDFKIWVNSAVNHGVEQLHMDMPFEIKLPCNVFRCRTLVVLKLRHFAVKDFSFADLHSLKTLHLDQITFSDPSYLRKLLNGCPVLEDLGLQNIFFDVASNQGELETFSKLVRADVNISMFRIPLKAFRNAEFLRSEFSTPISVFRNLTHLEIILGYNHTCTWYMVFEMIKHCPKLQILVLDKDVNFNRFLDGIQPYLHLIPECISSHLRRFSIINYNNKGSELLFAKYILQNSKSLRTMTISLPSSSNMSQSNKSKMINELSTCPRSSATCTLICF